MSSNSHASLAEVDRRLDALLERVGVGAAAKPRIHVHLEGLRQKEALVRREVEEAYEESRQALGELGRAIDHVFRLVEIELEIAAAAAAGELASDANAFGDALAAEVDAWDLYLERLQAGAAAMPDPQRAEAEAALRGIRQHRNALARLAGDTHALPRAWRQQKSQAVAVRRAIERAVDDAAVRFG